MQFLLVSLPPVRANRGAFYPASEQVLGFHPSCLCLFSPRAASVLLKLFGCHSSVLWVFCHFLMLGCVCCQEEFTGTLPCLPGAGSRAGSFLLLWAAVEFPNHTNYIIALMQASEIIKYP